MLDEFKNIFLKEKKGFKVKTEAYWESSRTSVMELFEKLVNGYSSVTEFGIREFGIPNSQTQNICTSK